jgi:CheY-like chemotaxis protein
MRVPQASLEGHSILVVEDQPLAALDTQEILESAGAEVLIVGDPCQALSRLDQFDFSAAVIHCWVPSDGLTMLMERLRQRGLPFLCYVADRTAKVGTPIVPKPVPQDEIVSALVALLS